MDRPNDPGQAQRSRKLAAALFTAGTVGISAILSFPISQFSPFRSPSQSPIPRALDPPEPLVRPFLRPLPQERGEIRRPATTRPGSEEAPSRPPGDVPDEEEEDSDDRVAPGPSPVTGTLTLATLTKPPPPTTTKPGGDEKEAAKRSAGNGTAAGSAAAKGKSKP